MSALVVILIILLLLSIAANGLQWYRWHSYRSKPAGVHSHTGMMPKITATQKARDQR